MSRSQKLNPEDNKISKNSTAKGLESTLQCVPISSSSTQKSNTTRVKSGLKQKLVNKVKSWSSKETKGFLSIDASTNPTKSDSNLAHIDTEIRSLNLTENFEDNMYTSDLVRAKDSLENLLGHRSDNKTVSGECRKLRLYKDHTLSKECSNLTSLLGGSSSVDNATKVTWDPWNKLGRKNKRDKRKKQDKSSHTNENPRKSDPIIKIKDHTAGDEPRTNITGLNVVLNDEALENFEYQPYRQNKKSVKFVNEVLVVYFTGDEVINKTTEPLKRELDQQIRNKEMRRGHIDCTMAGITQSNTYEDIFPSIWHKR